MGCDIHLFVERRDSQGVWESADTWTPSEYSSTNKLAVAYNSQFYNGRNYNLFGMLANVRNGRGFAGIRTGEGFNPISEPKGLPDDVSSQVKAESDYWDCDGHSHSWLTVRRLCERLTRAY